MMLSMLSGWGSTFSAISFYYDLIFKRCVPSRSIIIVIERGRGHCGSSYSYTSIVPALRAGIIHSDNQLELYHLYL